MNFEDLYNPKHVYEGFFETYFIRPFYHEYFDFKGHESKESCMKSLFAWLVITLGIIGIMLGQIGIIGPDGGIQLAVIVCVIWFILSVIPIFALVKRTLNGSPARPLKSRMLGIDTMLGVTCLLFFVLGLLMMVTTLDSGELNPNARVVEETDSSIIEQEYIKEEPIFTYQDENSSSDVSSEDTMKDFNEKDLVEQDESFDPTLQQPLDLSTDSI